MGGGRDFASEQLSPSPPLVATHLFVSQRSPCLYSSSHRLTVTRRDGTTTAGLLYNLALARRDCGDVAVAEALLVEALTLERTAARARRQRRCRICRLRARAAGGAAEDAKEGDDDDAGDDEDEDDEDDEVDEPGEEGARDDGGDAESRDLVATLGALARILARRPAPGARRLSASGSATAAAAAAANDLRVESLYAEVRHDDDVWHMRIGPRTAKEGTVTRLNRVDSLVSPRVRTDVSVNESAA